LALALDSFTERRRNGVLTPLRMLSAKLSLDALTFLVEESWARQHFILFRHRPSGENLLAITLVVQFI